MRDGLRLFGVLGLAGGSCIGRYSLLRRGRGFIHGGLDFIGHFTRSFLEFFDTLAEALGKFRQFPGSEKDQDQREDENDLTATQVKQTEHGIHT